MNWLAYDDEICGIVQLSTLHITIATAFKRKNIMIVSVLISGVFLFSNERDLALMLFIVPSYVVESFLENNHSFKFNLRNAFLIYLYISQDLAWM